MKQIKNPMRKTLTTLLSTSLLMGCAGKPEIYTPIQKIGMIELGPYSMTKEAYDTLEQRASFIVGMFKNDLKGMTIESQISGSLKLIDKNNDKIITKREVKDYYSFLFP